MPPDMNLTPPENKKENKKKYDVTTSKANSLNTISVEDILTGEIKKTKKNNSKKNRNVRKTLINKVLKTKASKVIE